MNVVGFACFSVKYTKLSYYETGGRLPVEIEFRSEGGREKLQLEILERNGSKNEFTKLG